MPQGTDSKPVISNEQPGVMLPYMVFSPDHAVNSHGPSVITLAVHYSNWLTHICHIASTHLALLMLITLLKQRPVWTWHIYMYIHIVTQEDFKPDHCFCPPTFHYINFHLTKLFKQLQQIWCVKSFLLLLFLFRTVSVHSSTLWQLTCRPELSNILANNSEFNDFLILKGLL